MLSKFKDSLNKVYQKRVKLKAEIKFHVERFLNSIALRVSKPLKCNWFQPKYFALSFYLLFCFNQSVFAQNEREINGMIVADSIENREVSVFNLRTNLGTNSQSGSFRVNVRVGDTLFFSSLYYKIKKVPITKSNITNDPFFVNLKEMVFELNEVQLRDVELSGLLAMDAANIETKPTPDLTKTGAFSFREPMSVEDRRLHTATTSPGGIPFDYFLNKWSGRLDMLIRQKAYARKKRQVKKAKKSVSDHFFEKELEISPDLVEDFIYFCLRFKKFKLLLRQNDKLKLINFYRSKTAPYKEHRLGEEID